MDNLEQKGVTIRELQDAHKRRSEETFHPIHAWSPMEYSACIAGEVGEAVNFVKKIRRLEDGEHKPYNQGVDSDALTHEIGKELADSIAYHCLLASRLGINLEEYIINKFNSVSEEMGSSVMLADTRIE